MGVGGVGKGVQGEYGCTTNMLTDLNLPTKDLGNDLPPKEAFLWICNKGTISMCTLQLSLPLTQESRSVDLWLCIVRCEVTQLEIHTIRPAGKVHL